MSSLYQRRRSIFQPNDPTGEEYDPSVFYPSDAPQLGPAGAPTPAPSPTLYTPPPTSVYQPAPPPQQDRLEAAKASLYGPTPDVTQSAPIQTREQPPDQGQPKSIYERYGVTPPTEMPPPRHGFLFSPQAYGEDLKRWQTQSEAEHRRAQMELNAAIAAQQHELQSQYARNLGTAAPAESQFAAILNDPTASPERKAEAERLLNESRRFSQQPTPFGVWQQQNPDKPVSEFYKIQPSVQGAQIRLEREPASNSQLFYGPDNTPYAFDPRSKTAQPVTLPGGGQAPTLTKPGGSNIFTPDDAKAIADAIMAGQQPPKLTGLYRNAAPIRAELARRGYDLSHAEMDWNATSRFLATLNNPQQVRLRQAVEFARESVPMIDNLYDKLNELAPRSGFRLLNKATIKAMEQLPGEAGATAQALETQLNHLTTELGNIYMGGNTPTDQSLKLGATSMQSDWNIATWKKNRDLLMKNLDIRLNSIASSSPQGVSPGTPYGIKGAPSPPSQTAAPVPTTPSQKFSHVSESGKYGWDGTKWVPISK